MPVFIGLLPVDLVKLYNTNFVSLPKSSPNVILISTSIFVRHYHWLKTDTKIYWYLTGIFCHSHIQKNLLLWKGGLNEEKKAGSKRNG
jgi:hypothetical protein